jgi:hypothetical protein
MAAQRAQPEAGPVIQIDAATVWKALEFCFVVYHAYEHNTGMPSDSQVGPDYFPKAERDKFTAWFTNKDIHNTKEKGGHFFGLFERANASGVGGEVVVCFMGTQTPGDWATDMAFYTEFALAKKEPGQQHAGFTSRAECAPIASILERLHAGWRVLLCGHSLGGAVANTVRHFRVAILHSCQID